MFKAFNMGNISFFFALTAWFLMVFPTLLYWILAIEDYRNFVGGVTSIKPVLPSWLTTGFAISFPSALLGAIFGILAIIKEKPGKAKIIGTVLSLAFLLSLVLIGFYINSDGF